MACALLLGCNCYPRPSALVAKALEDGQDGIDFLSTLLLVQHSKTSLIFQDQGGRWWGRQTSRGEPVQLGHGHRRRLQLRQEINPDLKQKPAVIEYLLELLQPCLKRLKYAVLLGPGIRLAALKSTMRSKKGLQTSGVNFNTIRGTNFLLWNYKNAEFSVHRFRFISLLYIEHSTGIQTGDLCVYRFNGPTLQPKNISKENYSLNSLTPLPTWATKFLSLPCNFLT